METSSVGETGAFHARGWRAWCLYGALPLLAVLATTWLFLRIFHSAPITTDENSYVFQACNFLSGRLARPMPLLPSVFFHEMIIMDDRVGWMSRYPPGHPLWLLPGCLFNHPHVMVSLAAGLAVWLMARMGALFGRREAWLAPLLLTLSPFFLFSHGTVLSHTSGMLAATVLLFGFLRWQMQDAPRFAALAGLGWSWLFLNRTFTAACLAIPFGVYALICLWPRRREKAYWQGLMLFAGTAALGVALILIYNKLATGHASTMTYLLYDPSETPGFGLRHLRGTSGIHTPSIGLGFLRGNLDLLNHWLFGFAGSLVLAGALALLGWRKAWTPLLLAVPFCVWGGYVTYYYPGPRETGPGYYLETLPFVILATTLGLARAVRWAQARSAWLVSATVLAGAILLAADLRFMAAQGRQLSAFNKQIGELLACIRGAPKDALILATEDGNPYSGLRHGLCVFNPWGLDSQPLVARSLGPGNQLLCRLFPARTPYLLCAKGTPHLAPFSVQAPYDEERFCQNIALRTGARRLGGTRGDRLQFEAKAGRDAREYLACDSEFALFPGRFVMEFDLGISNAPPSQPTITLDVLNHSDRTILAAGHLTGNSTTTPTLAFTITKNTAVEPRVYYRGVGDVVFRGFHLREIAPPKPGETGAPDKK